MNKQKPKGEVFEGHSGEMKDSPWLASEDIMHLKEIEVTIEKCHRYRNVEFEAGRSESVVYALEFVGGDKQLVLNSTNRRTLVNKYGTNVKEWSGKKIKLYVDHNVKLMGKIVCGIRMK